MHAQSYIDIVKETYCQVWIAYRQWGTVGKPPCEEKKKAQWESALLAVEEHTKA